jgi:hypothetical protein
MNLTTARDTLVAHLNAALSVSRPTLKVFYDNTGPIDLTTAGDMFLVFELRFDQAEQGSLEENPFHRTWGMLSLQIFVKEGKGYRGALQLADELVQLFRMKTLSGLITKVPVPAHHETHDGWMSQEILVPFWFDSYV